MNCPRSARVRPAARRAFAVVLVLLMLVPVGVASAITPPGMDTFSGWFGVGTGTFGSVDATAASMMVDSQIGLAGIDLMTGGMHGGDVSNTTGVDHAGTAMMADQGLLAVDLNQIAEQARLQAEAARRQAQQRADDRGIALERASDPGTPEPWELKNFSSCGARGNTSYEARIEAVDLFERMCADAANDGVSLIINSAFRDPRHQYRLYQNAIRKYGSPAAARRWVAWSDGKSCTSRHCSGTAIDVNMAGNDRARAWMHAQVGCATRSNVRLTQDSCGSGEQVVKRVQLYGMVLPMDHEPWHIEVGLATGSVEGTCTPPANYSAPQTIAAVWRCRLGEAGLDQATIERTVAEAIVVAKCESGWETNAVVFGGRYLNSPHPRTGSRYSAAGLFQFIRSSANSWVDGGYANVHDPVANADGAVRYWLSGYRRGGRTTAWQPWACVAVNDGFATKSVLPGFPGGPSSLPSYAHQY